jgi:hypothetical protein
LILDKEQGQPQKQPLSNKGKNTGKTILPLPRLRVAKKTVDRAVVVIDRMTIRNSG